MMGITQWLRASVRAGPWGDSVNLPLLDRREISVLRERPPRRTRPLEHQREVAHRGVGDARSVYRGTGLDYEESRPYQVGDELRFMNWRVTARTGALHVKVFRQERRPSVFIVVDRRSPMRFGTRVRLKATQAARAAAVTAFCAQMQNMPVGGAVLDPHPHWIATAGGESASLNLIDAAAAPCPPLNDSVDEVQLGHIIRLLQGMLVRGTVVYLISDFHDLNDACRPSLLQLALEHRVCALHIVDPAETRLPPLGPVRLRAGGESEPIAVDARDPRMAQMYEQAAQEYLSQRQQILVAQGIPYARISTTTEALENKIPIF